MRALIPLIALLLSTACPRPLGLAVTDVALPCPAEPATAALATLPLTALLADNIDEARAGLLLGTARTFWRRYGLEIVVDARTRTRLSTVVARDDTSAAPRDAQEALALLLAPAFHLVQARAHETGSRADLVLLPRLSPPNSRATRFFTRLDGFTVSPLHERELADDPEVVALYAALGTTDFRPTMFVAVPRAAETPPGEPDYRLAHEIGHVLGLDHKGGGKSLMSLTRAAACPELDDEERATVARSIAALTAG